MKYSHYGFDFTDESFYLVWMSNPFIYPASITQFGFVYHPLYKLLDGDIATLRQANILIVYLLAWLLSFAYLHSLATNARGSRLTLAAISAGLAVCALTYFDLWLATPSYNSLAFQALLIAALGLLLCEKEASRTSISGWILVSVGGWLAFMAKPSTAAALALCALAYLLIARKLSVQMTMLAIACTATLLFWSALAIDGSVLGFVKRLQLGLESARLMGGGHTLSQMLRIDRFVLDEKFKLVFLSVFMLLVMAMMCMLVNNEKGRVAGVVLSIVFLFSTFGLALGREPAAIALNPFQALLIFTLSMAAVVAAVIIRKSKTLTGITSCQWAFAALCLGMPHVYAFGTNNNYWQQGGAAGIFWLLAGLVFIGPVIRERASLLLLIPLAIAAPMTTAVHLQKGLENPYRQPQALRLNNVEAHFGSSGSRLLLSEGYATYIGSATAKARQAGFSTNTPMIDLSGQSPGILFALGAENVGQAWMIGGYPGSVGLAEFSLQQAPCEKIASAWLLHEPNGPRSLSTSVLTKFGASIVDDYQNTGHWQTAAGVGGYVAPRVQELHRPINQAKTLVACKTIRAQLAK